MTQRCNICGSTEFKDYKKRINAECVGCGSLERNRVMFLALTETGILKPGTRVLHIAPEAGIGRSLQKLVGGGYSAVDLSPENYAEDLGTTKFDLTKDIFDLPANSYDLIIHSHVMEHLPCDIAPVLFHLHRSLAPGGMHVICVPIVPGKYSADFNQMTKQDRRVRFGRFDHVRLFGSDDIQMTIGMTFDLKPFDPWRKHTGEELAGMGITERLPANVFSSNTVFLQDKDSIRLK